MTNPDDIGWFIDLENQIIVWDGGFVIPIDGMLDIEGFETEDPDEAVVIYFRTPPDSIVIAVDLRSIDPDRLVETDEEEPLN